MIRAAAPEATELIIAPVLRAFKNHCSLYPASGAVLDALGAELKPYLRGKATIRFQADKPLPDLLVRKIVKVRIEENAARS